MFNETGVELLYSCKLKERLLHLRLLQKKDIITRIKAD